MELILSGLNLDESVKVIDKYLYDRNYDDIDLLAALISCDLDLQETIKLQDKYLEVRGDRDIGFTMNSIE